MRIVSPRLELSDDMVVSEITVEPDAGDARVLRLGIDRAFVGAFDPGPTPFVPIAAIMASALDEDLVCEEPVSPQVARGAEYVTEVFSRWWGLHPVHVHGPRAEAPFVEGREQGLFFTRGVDSSFTLLRSLNGEIPERFTHLLLIDELDHWVSPETRAAVFHGTRRAAEHVGLPSVRFTTNARELLDPVVEWRRSHGTVLAACALVVGASFRRVAVSATLPHRYSGAIGSHFEVDGHWSSERTTITHEGAEATRPEKTARVAESSELLACLKVCWIADTPGNCGRCPKCLLTMTVLETVDALEPGLFEEELTPEAIRSAAPSIPPEFVREQLDWLARCHAPTLAAAWEDFASVHGIDLATGQDRGPGIGTGARTGDRARA